MATLAGAQVHAAEGPGKREFRAAVQDDPRPVGLGQRIDELEVLGVGPIVLAEMEACEAGVEQRPRGLEHGAAFDVLAVGADEHEVGRGGSLGFRREEFLDEAEHRFSRLGRRG